MNCKYGMLGNRSEILRKRAHYCKELLHSATVLVTTSLFLLSDQPTFRRNVEGSLYYLLYCMVL